MRGDGDVLEQEEALGRHTWLLSGVVSFSSCVSAPRRGEANAMCGCVMIHAWSRARSRQRCRTCENSKNVLEGEWIRNDDF
jgi:hypothetical protein